jgi:predicted RNA-binding protein (virulence factor B family)
MIKLGEYNRLTVARVVEIGIYLDGGEYWGDILLPNASTAEGVKENANEGDELEVFIYFDSEDRVIATMERPLAMVGDFAALKVVGTSRVGAFLDWGLRKDLLVPFREQREEMVVGRAYLVRVYVDKTTDRIVASTRWGRFLDRGPAAYQPDDEVELIIAQRTDMGYRVIVDNAHEAMIYDNEVFQPLRVGEKVTGYVKRTREDGKIDCVLQRNDGHHEIDRVARRVVERLRENGGRLAVSDKSAPAEIHALFGCSKKNYKKAVGGLFRQRLVDILEGEIKLL